MSLIDLLLKANCDTREHFFTFVTYYNEYATEKKFTLISANQESALYDDYQKTNNITQIRNRLYLVQEVTYLNDLPFLFHDKSSVVYRNIRTINGLDFDVVKSGLQKYIRRGNIRKAIECGVELFMFQFVKDGKSAFTNFINRLRAIVVEDIGIAFPTLILQVDKQLKEIKKGNVNTLVNCITLMCNCLHTRFYSHVNAHDVKYASIYYVIEEKDVKINGKTFPIENDTYFTRSVNQLIYAMKQKNVRACHWIKEIAYSSEKLKTKRYRRCKPAYLVFAIVEWIFKEEKVHPLLLSIFNCCLNWYHTLKVKESILLLVHPVYVYMFYNQEDLKESLPVHVDASSIYNLNLRYDPNKVFFFDDYVCDKHTRVGKMKGKTMTDFAVEGSLVAHENTLFNSTFSQNYLMGYIHCRFKYRYLKKETEMFNLKARAQLTCRMKGMDTYFATLKTNNENVVVKGPWKNFDSIYKSYSLISIQSFFSNLNIIPMTIKLGKIDMFENVPMGFRKFANNKKPYYFAVYHDMFDQSEYETIVKTSTLWKEGEKVVDYEKLFEKNRKLNFGVPSKLSEKARISLIHAMAWRYMFEIGDFAYRNFLCVNDKVYNIDVENIFVGNALTWSKGEKQILKDTFRKHRNEIIQVWNAWLVSNKGLGQDKWYMIENILELNKQDVCRIHNNCNYLISSFEEWIQG